MNAYKLKTEQVKIDFSKLKNQKIKIHELDTKPLNALEVLFLFFNYLILIMWSFIILFPVVSLLVSSFNIFNPRFVTLTPFRFGWDNFDYLFNSERSFFGHWYINTIIIAVSTMVISTVFVALNGYAYSRFKFRGSKWSLSFIMVVQMIPVTASLISLYIIVNIGKQISFSPLIMLVIIYSGMSIAGNTFIFKGYLDTISRDLDDSGKIDGCNNWTLFIRLILPIAKPMLAIIALWSFLTPFGDVVLPKFILFDLKDFTLPVGLDTFINTAPKDVNAGAYSAGSILASIPTFALFMFLQKFITGRLQEGSVKG
ncbi:sugar ABC transporter permease [Candidatus Mycoplasma pogonae]